MLLKDKVAVVTGGSSGIGAATVRMLAAEGASVAICYNKGAERAQALLEQLPKANHRIQQLTLEDSASVRRAADEIGKVFGCADILINSAGFTRPIPHAQLDALDDALLDSILIANVRGPFSVIRALAPLLRAGGDGVIVNVSSISAFTGSGSNIGYCAAKAALDTMTLSLARVLGPQIRVLCVSPAAVATVASAATTKNIWYQTWPGSLWGKYDHHADSGMDEWLADILPLSSTFTGHLDGAEALYDGSNHNLIGVRNFLSGTPQLAVMLGMTRGGKSTFMCDLLSQTELYFDYTVIIEEGLSYGIYTKAVDPNAELSQWPFEASAGDLIAFDHRIEGQEHIPARAHIVDQQLGFRLAERAQRTHDQHGIACARYRRLAQSLEPLPFEVVVMQTALEAT